MIRDQTVKLNTFVAGGRVMGINECQYFGCVLQLKYAKFS